MQGRLLHQRDGLALWNLKEPVDMEALSNEAIVMLVELWTVIFVINMIVGRNYPEISP